MNIKYLIPLFLLPNIALSAPSTYLFGGSQADGFGGQILELHLLGGTTYLASTSVNPIGQESYAENFGWWSDTIGHLSGNYNYLAGYNGALNSWNRNFFSFDLSSVQDTIVSATLHLNPYAASYPFSEMQYDLYDVSTSATDLLMASGPSSVIFNDLGSGTLYGSYLFNTDPSIVSDISINLTAGAISDLNNRSAAYFTLGGAVTPVPLPLSSGLFSCALFILVQKKLRKSRNC